MKDPIEKLLNAKTIQEVDNIILLNWQFFIKHPGLLELAKHSKNRIRRIERMRHEVWYPLEN